MTIIDKRIAEKIKMPVSENIILLKFSKKEK
jgi:hypothetical protein